MATTSSFRRTALSLVLLSIILGATSAYATTEGNYGNDNNFLTNISESTHIENGYKANIIINSWTTGIYATENGYKLDLIINTQGMGGSFKENGYKLDLIPEKTFPDIPDVAVTDVVISKKVIGQGYTALITVNVSNKVLSCESFNVIIQANTTTIRTQTAMLIGKSFDGFTFMWDTTDLAKGNYTISALAEPVPGEIDTADNSLSFKIIVTIPGDVKGDFVVDILDAILLSNAFNSYPGQPNWNPNADIKDDNIVDILDAIILSNHYGQHYP